MTRLENPPENPCFGCGPNHPRGLRLSFSEEAAPDGAREVVATFEPKPDEIGWPTLFHHGLHFLVLYEASYWAALTLGGRLMVSQGPIQYTAVRLPRVGVRHVARARLDGTVEGRLRVRSVTATDAGKPCATLESEWIPVAPGVPERAGISLPSYLTDEIRPA